jgi:ferredoxin--NADP+ reductase
VRPDWGSTSFLPGQYTVLGLGNWEPRVDGVDTEELSEEDQRKLLKRAYSFSCPMLDDAGHLVPPTYGEHLEFYVVLVRHGEEHPPGLTPRMFHLAPGDRLFMGRKVTGHYTLDGVSPDDNVVFVATGTGEAPHNAMVAELLSMAHRGRLIAVTCVRYRRDLGYEATYRELERRYSNLRYLTLTTREPENLEPSLHQYVGRRYLQDFFASVDFERTSGLSLDPAHTYVFLCGNPHMIGAPLRGQTGPQRYPNPRGMVEVLEARGFTADESDKPGNIRFEKYW